MKTKMIILMASLGLTGIGCGMNHQVAPVEVTGEVVHTLEVDVDQLLVFFTKYCESRFTHQDDIDECVAKEMATFWKAFNAQSQEVSVAPSPRK